MRKVLFLIIFLLIFTYSLAEETGNKDKLPIYYLEPVIVTATRYPEYLTRIANHTSFFTGDQLEKKNLQNLQN